MEPRSRTERGPTLESILGLTLALVLGVAPAALCQVEGVEHVVVIGVDGLSPDGIRTAETPNLDRLVARGSSTMKARAVMPSSSSPNWASMLMGAGPEQHGVTSNDWEPDRHDLEPTTVGPGGIFPTIFSVLDQQRVGARLACFHDWDGFGRLFERDLVDRIEDNDGPEETIARAVGYITVERPTFVFIHLDHVDHAGHEHGHGTPEYYEAVELADALIGRAVEGLAAAGILDRTAILVTSDHGGVGKRHGGATMAEVEIPWILAGPGIAEGREIPEPVNTYDTAATIALLLGVKPPRCWIARPVTSALANEISPDL